MPKIKVKGQTVQTGEHPQTNGPTHTDATKRIIATAMRSIKIRKSNIVDSDHLKNRENVISRTSNFDKILHGGVDLASRP